jgi:hypothetical protein
MLTAEEAVEAEDDPEDGNVPPVPTRLLQAVSWLLFAGDDDGKDSTLLPLDSLPSSFSATFSNLIGRPQLIDRYKNKQMNLLAMHVANN